MAARRATDQERVGPVMMGTLINLALGFSIGLSLGLLGGGGSILTVPALVYLVGQSPQAAITASLAIVGATSALGAFFHRAQGTLNWRLALAFGGVGMVTSFLAAGLSRRFGPTALMMAFAVLMLIIGGLMIARRSSQASAGPQRGWPVVLASGAGVGLLTGFLGVGGGFLIVPALVLLVGVPMQQAVGTSLVVIAMNSLAGLLGHLGGPALDMALILTFVAAGVLGAFGGARLAERLPAARLRQLFALFVIVLALFLLYDNLPKLLG